MPKPGTRSAKFRGCKSCLQGTNSTEYALRQEPWKKALLHMSQADRATIPRCGAITWKADLLRAAAMFLKKKNDVIASVIAN